MREIGGYLSFENYAGQEYYSDLLRFNTGRNALSFLLAEKAYKKVLVPYYICESVINAIGRLSLEYEFYSLSQTLEPIISSVNEENEVVLIVNYFGRFGSDDLQRFARVYKNIIVDNTQAFFQRPVHEIDTIYTCRKYFGVSDGAYLSTSHIPMTYDMLERDCSADRLRHIVGRYDSSASQYYSNYSRAEIELDTIPVLKMSRFTQNILRSLDYQDIYDKRRENYEYLAKYLDDHNELFPSDHSGVFMYPFLCKNGSRLKEFLIQKAIYIPTLWPNVLEMCSKQSYEYYLANNLVLLPIDHRYNTEDMQYILEQIQMNMKGLMLSDN